MTTLQLSGREERLLNAALNPDGAIAAANWQAWASEIALEDAPHPELRLLTAVYGHLSRVAPALELPSKLRGKAKATFTGSNVLAYGCLPMVAELNRHFPVLVTKGLAICIRFNAWSSRTMVDVDIHVPLPSLEKACAIFAQSGWTPRFGMTWDSLVHRSSLRRDSWNITKGRLDLDLHWRVKEGPAENWLARNMWSSVVEVEFLGQKLLLQSPEFALLTALDHGFEVGSHADALQTIVDAASLLPLCKPEILNTVLNKAELATRFGELASAMDKCGLSEMVSKFSFGRSGPPDKARQGADGSNAPKSGSRAFCKAKTETAVLDRPWRYRLWELFGRKSRIERQMLRLTGPFSKRLTGSETFKEDYDLRDCAVIDQIGGPGWGWPEPDHACFWSDRADARLLVPLRHRGAHLIILGVSDYRHYSANARVNVFANGVLLAALDLRARAGISEYCLMVPAHVLFGPWVELSFRPQPYLGEGKAYDHDYSFKRSVPVQRLRIYDMHKMSEIFSGYHVPQLYFTMFKPDDPKTEKFDRIKRKIEESPYRNAAELPTDFNPVLYVLSYADLFEHEVDPFEHFVRYGRHEGRLWH